MSTSFLDIQFLHYSLATSAYTLDATNFLKDTSIYSLDTSTNTGKPF